MKSKNLVLFGALAVIAIVAFVMYGKGYPPKTGVEGTIGAATRYQSNQIGDNDVTLKDPKVQAFLQSDLFHKIQTNADLGRSLANPDARRVFMLREFQKMAADQAFIKVDGDARARRVLQLEALSALASDNNMVRVSSSIEARKLWVLEAYAKIAADEGYRRHLQVLDANKITTVDELRRRQMEAKIVTADSKFYNANVDDFNKLDVNADYRRLILSDKLNPLATSIDLAAFTTAGGFDLLTISNGDYRRVFQLREWNAAAAMPDFMSAIADANVIHALGDEGFTEILSTGDAARRVLHLSE